MEGILTQKRTDTDHQVHPLIEQRWSPRAFSDQPVENYKLKQLFEAARWAPSCYNEQPWHFIVATRDQPEAYEKILDSLVNFNRQWAQTAPVLMLTVTRNNFAQNGKDNDHAWYDLGQAVANLSLQATDLDLYVHQMAGFSQEQARNYFDIPNDYEPATAIAIGYLGDPDQLDDPLAEKENTPSSRKPLDDFVFTGEWGQKSEILD